MTTNTDRTGDVRDDMGMLIAVAPEETHAARMERLKDEAINMPLVKLQAFTAALTPEEALEIARYVEGHARYALRVSTYMESRWFGASHETAVKEQNTRSAKIDKALGYTSGHSEHNF